MSAFNSRVKGHVMALALHSHIWKNTKTLFSLSEHPAFSSVQIISAMEYYLPDIPIADTHARVASLLVSLLFSS